MNKTQLLLARVLHGLKRLFRLTDADEPPDHPFKFATMQRVVVVTDFARGGIILKRSARKYEAGTDAYFVTRDRDGVSEWYPEFALAIDVASAESARTDVDFYKCALGHLHRSTSEAVDCDITNQAVQA